jgi:hypothetical protein
MFGSWRRVRAHLLNGATVELGVALVQALVSAVFVLPSVASILSPFVVVVFNSVPA